MSELTPPPNGSPRWSSNTKLIVGLSVVAVVGAMLVYFRNILAPLLLAFVLAYLIRPLAAWTSRTLHLPWRMAVNLVFLLFIIAGISLIAMAGLALVQQAQSLIAFIDRFLSDLPATVERLSQQQVEVGPLVFDLSHLDLQVVVQQILGVVQPLLGRAGSLVGKFAAGAASTVGWGLFSLLVAYFLLAESGNLQDEFVHIEIPGYDADSVRLVRELTRIWDAFLRGQLIIALLIIVSYAVLLTLLGTRLSLAIALVAGIGGFIPYLGSAITWITVVIIAYFQPSNYFGLNPLAYTALVLGCCLVLNQIFDSFITPRFLGRTLGVHPAAVLIAAIIAANLIGIIGVMLAAPVLATVSLLGRYITRKMLDLDPWPAEESPPPEVPPLSRRAMRRAQRLWQRWQKRLATRQDKENAP